MKYILKYFSVLLMSSFWICPFTYSVNIYVNQEEEIISVPIEEKEISLPKDIPENVGCNELGKYLTKNNLKIIFPEIEKPRLMHVEDIKNPLFKSGYLTLGYSFLLKADSNKDGYDEVALIMQSDVPENLRAGCFFGILSIKEGKIVRQVFKIMPFAHVYLKKVEEFKPGLDAIQLIYTMGSDHCGHFYWFKDKYAYEKCDDSDIEIIIEDNALD